MQIKTKKDVNMFVVLTVFSILSIFFAFVTIKYVIEPLIEKSTGGVKKWLQSFYSH